MISYVLVLYLIPFEFETCFDTIPVEIGSYLHPIGLAENFHGPAHTQKILPCMINVKFGLSEALRTQLRVLILLNK